MKKLIPILLLLPVLAFAAPATYSNTANGVSGVCASTTCDAPTAGASLTDGILLGGSTGGLTSVWVTVCADSGQTLSGAGTLTAYARDPVVALWAAIPDLNLGVTVAAASVRCQSFSALAVRGPTGRVAWVPTGVTVSSGGVTVYISGF